MVKAISSEHVIQSNNGVQQSPKTIHAMDVVSKEQLYDPGRYALRELLGPPPEEHHRDSFISRAVCFVGKIAILAAVLSGAAVLSRKHVDVIKDVKLENGLAKDAKLSEQIKYYIAKSADFIEAEFKKLLPKKDKT